MGELFKNATVTIIAPNGGSQIIKLPDSTPPKETWDRGYTKVNAVRQLKLNQGFTASLDYNDFSHNPKQAKFECGATKEDVTGLIFGIIHPNGRYLPELGVLGEDKRLASYLPINDLRGADRRENDKKVIPKEGDIVEVGEEPDLMMFDIPDGELLHENTVVIMPRGWGMRGSTISIGLSGKPFSDSENIPGFFPAPNGNAVDAWFQFHYPAGAGSYSLTVQTKDGGMWHFSNLTERPKYMNIRVSKTVSPGAVLIGAGNDMIFQEDTELYWLPDEVKSNPALMSKLPKKYSGQDIKK